MDMLYVTYVHHATWEVRSTEPQQMGNHAALFPLFLFLSSPLVSPAPTPPKTLIGTETGPFWTCKSTAQYPT